MAQDDLFHLSNTIGTIADVLEDTYGSYEDLDEDRVLIQYIM